MNKNKVILCTLLLLSCGQSFALGRRVQMAFAGLGAIGLNAVCVALSEKVRQLFQPPYSSSHTNQK